MRNIKAFPCTVQYINTENGVCRKILDFYEGPDETSKNIIEGNNFSLQKISAYIIQVLREELRKKGSRKTRYDEPCVRRKTTK